MLVIDIHETGLGVKLAALENPIEGFLRRFWGSKKTMGFVTKAVW
jgi:hypothetical protein